MFSRDILLFYGDIKTEENKTDQTRRRKKKLTAEGDSRGGNNKGLDDSVLLASEWLFEKATVVEECSVGLDCCKPQQTCSYIEGWYDPCGEVEFAHNEDENYT